jgi:hypothetical protein
VFTKKYSSLLPVLFIAFAFVYWSPSLYIGRHIAARKLGARKIGGGGKERKTACPGTTDIRVAAQRGYTDLKI